MILARIIPKSSSSYKNIKRKISSYIEFTDKHNISYLFGVWTTTIAGYVYLLGNIDRYSYWEWSGLPNGILRILLSTLLFYSLSSFGIWRTSDMRLKQSDLIYNSLFYFGCFILGSVSFNVSNSYYVGLLPYLAFIISGVLIYEFKILYNSEKDDWSIDSWDKITPYMIATLILMIITTFLGNILDDPIISTVGIVSLFFPAVALIWPNDVRHIKRLQFYPLFTFAMFICVRAPWFFVILALLFFFLRSINYFKYGLVYPSFGVHLEEINSDV
jgi:hypothetical protein|tara:strand:+ start:10165 stop:10983 length:819 start_codon:yes stop_codon:yes gene_type:complete